MRDDSDSPEPPGRAPMAPPSTPPGDVTRFLSGAARGVREDVDRLLPLVYEELRFLALREMKAERADHTLQATALVHEAYLRLLSDASVEWKDRAHFFGFASHLIRRVLVEHARARGRVKRGGAMKRVTLADDLRAGEAPGDALDLLELDASLDRLALKTPDASRVVEMKFFAGMANDEIAAVMDSSTRTVERHWKFAQAWLYRDMSRRTG